MNTSYLKILIVDNLEANQIVLKRILAEYGQCEFSDSGKGAVLAFNEAWKEGKPYNLICLDTEMPGMNGMQALKAIRTLEQKMNTTSDERCAIVMVSATTDRGARDLAELNGSDVFILKPINQELFVRKLKELDIVT